MLTSNVCDILSCMNPETIMSIPSFCTRVTILVNFSEDSDIKGSNKKERLGKYKCFWVDFLLYIHAKQLK